MGRIVIAKEDYGKPDALKKAFERSRSWSRRLRSELESRFNYLKLDAQTEEEERDVRRLVDLMNDICAKHDRRSSR